MVGLFGSGPLFSFGYWFLLFRSAQTVVWVYWSGLFFHSLPAFWTFLMFYMWFFMVFEHLHSYLMFFMFWHSSFGLVFGLHFSTLLPSKMHLFTKHRKLRCVAYIWVFTCCWISSWVLFWCFTWFPSRFLNPYTFTSRFSCFGILPLVLFLVFIFLHFYLVKCTFLQNIVNYDAWHTF